MKKFLNVVVATLIIGCGTGVVNAAEKEILVGGGKTIVNSFDDPTSPNGKIEFRLPISDTTTGSISFINEGHPKDFPKRDGIAFQALWKLPFNLIEGRLAFNLGIGPYVFCATERSDTGFVDTHGVAALGLFETHYRFKNSPWTTSLMIHRVAAPRSRITRNGTDTDLVMLAVGRTFGN